MNRARVTRCVLWMALLSAVTVATSCTHGDLSPYEGVSAVDIRAFKRLPIPLPPGTVTKVRQGAFGKSSHNEAGNQYNWDFEVPLGTSVLAVADGVVTYVSQPSVGGCDAKYANSANVLQIKLADGTVAQYLHVETTLKPGNHVTKGQTIAHTGVSGWLCYPHVHFGVYASDHQLYSSPDRKTLPIFFVGISDGLACEGETYEVP